VQAPFRPRRRSSFRGKPSAQVHAPCLLAAQPKRVRWLPQVVGWRQLPGFFVPCQDFSDISTSSPRNSSRAAWHGATGSHRRARAPDRAQSARLAPSPSFPLRGSSIFSCVAVMNFFFFPSPSEACESLHEETWDVQRSDRCNWPSGNMEEKENRHYTTLETRPCGPGLIVAEFQVEPLFAAGFFFGMGISKRDARPRANKRVPRDRQLWQ
jgi:hypothetical protein